MARHHSLYLIGATASALAVSAAMAQDSLLPAGLQGEAILRSGETRDGDLIVYPTSTRAEITSVVGTIQPGTQTELHKNPFPTYVYVLEGEIEVSADGGSPQRFGQGDAYLASVNRRHSIANGSAAPARLLKVFIGQKDAPTTVPAK
jgi:quercetin dioxygenase-like cupin family protein